jgi:hypothetical protein
VIVVPKALIDSAERVADNAVDAVIDAIREEARENKIDRRKNAVWYFTYHSEILAGMTPARRRVAWWHKKMRRNARAAIKANAVLAAACPGVL